MDAASTSKRTGPPTREEILKKAKYEWGQLDVNLFVKKLRQEGIEFKLDQGTSGVQTIKLLSDDTSITVDENNTHVTCGNKQSIRLKIRDLLLQCVPSF